MTTRMLRPHATVAVGATEVEASGGRVDLDASRIPYAEASVELPLVDADDIELIDPRDGLRATVTANVGDGPRVFDLGLRARTVDHKSRTITLELASDEAMLQDWAPLAEDGGARTHEVSLRAVCDYVLDKIGASLADGSWDADMTAYWNLTNYVINPRTVSVDNYAVPSGSLGLDTTTGGVPGISTSYVYWYSAAAGPAPIYPGGDVRATPGKSYTASAYLRADDSSHTGRVGLRFFDANNILVLDVSTASEAIPPAPAWTRLSVSAEAPPGAEIVRMVAAHDATAGSQAAGISGAMLTEGDELVAFFSGASTDDGYTYTWSADADASSSTRTADVERLPELFVWKPGVTAWSFLEPLTSAAGLRLFCDEQRVWRLIDPAEYTLPGVATIAGWNATDGTDTISRADPNLWCTGVVVRYRWEDANGVPREATDSAGDDGLVLVWEYNRPYPGPGAAAAILARRAGAGRVQDVTALADLTITPGMEASISLPATVEQVGTLQSVAWTLTDGLMQVGTRGLIDVLPGTIDGLLGTIDDLVGTIDDL